MKLDQFHGIAAFLKVAETRSFTRAAAELGLATASVSEAVRGLETRLGVRLLNRTTRSVGLTEAGAAYLARVGPAAEAIRSAGAALAETGERPAGTLRLTLPWIAAPLFIEPLMEPFLARYPDVRLDLVFDDSFVDLAAQGFDAGLRIGELLEKDMVAVPVGPPLATAVLASPAYLARHGAPETPADLAGHACIAYRFASNRAISTWDFSVDGRAVSFTPDARLSANTMPLVVAAAAKGIGLAYATRALAQPHIAEGTLVPLLERYCPKLEAFHVYYPTNRLMPPKLRAFLDFMRAQRSRRARDAPPADIPLQEG